MTCITPTRAFVDALFDMDPADRLPLIEIVLDDLRAGQPVPSFMGIMAEASHWADWASRAELKAYALACFRRMAPADQRAFLDHVQGRAAA